jgi:hypothetical protein
LYARGPQSEIFLQLLRGKDPQAAAVWNFNGDYVDNTDVFYVMKASVEERRNQECRNKEISRSETPVSERF